MAGLRARKGLRRRLLPGLCLVLVGWGTPSAPAWAEPPTTREHQIRAALLFSIAKFVTWPGIGKDGRDEPLLFCVVGEGQFVAVLRGQLAGKRVRGRPIKVRQFNGNDPLKSCNLLYLIDSLASPIRGILTSLNRSPILTVSTAGNFLDLGGTVRILRRNGRLRFAVNLKAAEVAGLRLDARLLKLATEVLDSDEDS